MEGATDGLLIPRVVACPTHQCAIFMGNDDGTFQPRVDYASPYRPATGDFNGDERLDIVTVNQSNDNVSILLQGTTVALSDTSLEFPLQLVGTSSAPQPLTLTNSGPITLTISSITTSRDFLQENNCDSSVPAGASCTIRVAFQPSAKGVRNGALTITDNALDSPRTVALTGTGTVVQLSPLNVNFGNQRVGTISPRHTVTLTNIGIAGTNFGDFVETTTCGSRLPANASCAIQVRFKPRATGPR